MNKVLTIATLLMLTTLGARAEQNVNIEVKPSADAGTVTYNITGVTNGVGGVCTLTVTPASGYYLTVENLTATPNLDGSGVQARRKTEVIDVSSETLTITPTNASADPSSVTTYTFNMPTDGSLNVDVTAEFQLLETPTSYSVSVTGWIYGELTNAPVLNGFAGDQTKVEYYYKLSSSNTWSAWSEISSTTDASNYDIKASVPAYNKYAAAEVTNTFTISKANINVVTIGPIADQTYSGLSLTPDVTVTFNDEDLATDEYTVSYENNVNAGEATVKLTGSGKNFSTSSTTTAKFKIVAASLDNAIIGVDENVTYSGSEVKPTVTVRLTAESDALKQNEDYEVAYSNNINVASADATVAPTVTITGIGNYTGSKSVTFTITKGTPDVTAPTAKDGLTYNGELQDLIDAGSTTGGKLIYSLKENEGYGEAIPQGQNAGSYTVYYKVEGNDNYNGTVAQSVAVTIGPKAVKSLVIELNPNTFEYDGTEHIPQVTVYEAEKHIDGFTPGDHGLPGRHDNFGEEYPSKDTRTVIPEEEYNVTYPENCIEVGSYKVVVVDAGKNYIFDGSANFEITKGTPEVTAPTAKDGLTYNGGLQDLIEDDGSTTGGTLKYSLDGTNYDTTIPQGQDAGSYTVYYKVEGNDNYNGTVAQSVAVTIAPKEVKNPTIELSSASFECDGQDHKPTVTVKDGETKLTENTDYTVDYQKDGASIQKCISVGIYTVVVSSVEGGNYIVSGSETFEIVAPKKQDPVVTITPAQNLTYTSYSQQLLLSANTTGGTLQFRIESYKNSIGLTNQLLSESESWSNSIPEGTDAGTYTIGYKVVGNNEYKDLDAQTIDVTIKGVDYKMNTDGSATITGSGSIGAGGGNYVIPSTVPDQNGQKIPVTAIGGGAFKDAGPLTTIDLTGLKNTINIGKDAVGDAMVEVNPEQLEFYAQLETMYKPLQNGQLIASLSAKYDLITFSCGIDLSIPKNYPIHFTIGNEKVELGTIPDATKYLQFYKCKVDQDAQVVATNITEKMQNAVAASDAVKYKANNGILISCDIAGMEEWAKNINVANVIGQIKDIKALINQIPELQQYIKENGFETAIALGTNDIIKDMLLKNPDILKTVKETLMPVIKEKAATLVAQYTEKQTIATEDAKSYGNDNMLVPVTKKKSFIPLLNGNYYYVLYNGQFHSILDNGSEVSACKAVLEVPVSLIGKSAQARTLSIMKGDDETTSIKDSEVRMMSDDAWYNLSGQRIEEPTKPGIYIYKGKKVKK